ncbi:hypothetical protein [Rickettsia australis]|uniref:Uncharacterized protein n=1 Tax=Rickettsia australis (strain Cutlack) TaxID=1105110 RepID=H8K9F0_RICAC|nr:hypothetical protein [Rickettsia australis]AFC70670.1 hypothetical protein MC5_01315 [Rickettsia australis str. Cutlack]
MILSISAFFNKKLRFIEFNKDIVMFKGQFQPSYKKLIEIIKAENKTEAQNLIAKMDIAELSKATSVKETQH